MCSQQRHCGFPRRTLFLLNTIEALYSLYSFYTQNIGSVNRIYTGLKSPKNVNSGTNGGGKPRFGPKLCRMKAPGPPNPPDPKTCQKDQKSTKKRQKREFWGFLGPVFGALFAAGVRFTAVYTGYLVRGVRCAPLA